MTKNFSQNISLMQRDQFPKGFSNMGLLFDKILIIYEFQK